MSQKQDMTTYEKIIMDLQSYIRAEGHVTAIKLSMRAVEFGIVSDMHNLDIDLVLDSVTKAPDIHVIEYTNSMVADYRVKDLFYFNPHQKK